MTKTINLYFDFEFTSLSPDAQPISLGIVSDNADKDIDFPTSPKSPVKALASAMLGGKTYSESKSFYVEFTDFDINRCDDWVKENIVEKLILQKGDTFREDNQWESIGDIIYIKEVLIEWLKQFSDYQIQFVCDCGTFDWYWMLQLLAEWEEKRVETPYCLDCGYDVINNDGKWPFKTGLPKLPYNISPVPEDLNDLIARVNGITVREAFDLNREELVKEKLTCKYLQSGKHNAMFDADVIKEIYQKLK
jgi:hypothetical protein